MYRKCRRSILCLLLYEHLEFIAKAYRLEGLESYAEELPDGLRLTDKKNKLGKELPGGNAAESECLMCPPASVPDVVILNDLWWGLDPARDS